MLFLLVCSLLDYNFSPTATILHLNHIIPAAIATLNSLRINAELYTNFESTTSMRQSDILSNPRSVAVV